MVKTGSPSIRSTEALGRVLRTRRESLGLTQAQLADEAGLTRQAVLNIEAGHETQALHNLLETIATLGLELTVRERVQHDS